MSIVNTVITIEQLGHDFSSLFQRRAFRLLTRDYYDAENEREPYARFLAGEPVDPAWREPWKRLVREVRASGRIMERVHVVSEPLSDYMRFTLLHGYPANVEAGEDVRIMGGSDAWPPDMDFWLFDDNLAALLNYDSNGRCYEVRLMGDDMAVRHHLGWARDETLRLSIPLAQYVADHHITERTHAA